MINLWLVTQGTHYRVFSDCVKKWNISIEHLLKKSEQAEIISSSLFSFPNKYLLSLKVFLKALKKEEKIKILWAEKIKVDINITCLGRSRLIKNGKVGYCVVCNSKHIPARHKTKIEWPDRDTLEKLV